MYTHIYMCLYVHKSLHVHDVVIAIEVPKTIKLAFATLYQLVIFSNCLFQNAGGKFGSGQLVKASRMKKQLWGPFLCKHHHPKVMLNS